MKTLVIFLTLSLGLFAGVSEGDKAIDFNLKALNGTKTYSMKNFKGKVVLLNLWASWCKGCKKEMPEFFHLQKSMGSSFKIVAVNVDSSSSKGLKFLKSIEAKTGIKTPFVSLKDPSKSLAKAYKCSAMPSSYLIDKKGIIRAVIIGSLNSSDISKLKKEIRKLQ